jgi:hypothetical protein
MEHVLEQNKKTILAFVKKSQQFLNLPRKFWEADILQSNPKTYKGVRGKAAIKRARAGTKILKRIDADLKKIIKLLS